MTVPRVRPRAVGARYWAAFFVAVAFAFAGLLCSGGLAWAPTSTQHVVSSSPAAGAVAVGVRRTLAVAGLSSLMGMQPTGEALAATTQVSSADDFVAGVAGDANLYGQPLQACTQAQDRVKTGWTRTGTCAWEPSDRGYHQVCVAMSEQFLQSSRKYDRNDLSRVVGQGGHWCICAWAWASAVQRDPRNFEGLQLDCERTNGRLRNVYRSFVNSSKDLMSPSGARYPAQGALAAVNAVCGD